MAEMDEASRLFWQSSVVAVVLLSVFCIYLRRLETSKRARLIAVVNGVLLGAMPLVAVAHISLLMFGPSEIPFWAELRAIESVSFPAYLLVLGIHIFMNFGYYTAEDGK